MRACPGDAVIASVTNKFVVLCAVWIMLECIDLQRVDGVDFVYRYGFGCRRLSRIAGISVAGIVEYKSHIRRTSEHCRNGTGDFLFTSWSRDEQQDNGSRTENFCCSGEHVPDCCLYFRYPCHVRLS